MRIIAWTQRTVAAYVQEHRPAPAGAEVISAWGRIRVSHPRPAARQPVDGLTELAEVFGVLVEGQR